MSHDPAVTVDPATPNPRPSRPAGWRKRWPSRWRKRWRKRNDPRLVRAMFWRGLHHGIVLARIVIATSAVGLALYFLWQALS